MLRATYSRGQGFFVKHLLTDSSIGVPSTQRLLSTSSAIRRGLRKSRPRTDQDKFTSQHDRYRSKPSSAVHRLPSFDRRDALPKKRRPNHQEGLDVEDWTHSSSSTKIRQARNQRSSFPGALRNGKDTSSSFRKPSRESSIYRSARDSSYDPRLGLNRDTRRSDTASTEAKEDARQDKLRSSRLYKSSATSAFEPNRTREDAFRKQMRTWREDSELSPSSRSTGERKQPYRQFKTSGRTEAREPSSYSRDVRKSPTRAEKRLALYGRGDTASGGIPRSEVEVEENGKILRPASKLLRIAAKRRQLGVSEPGLADDELDVVSHRPPRRSWAGEDDSSIRDHEEPWRVKEKIPLSIPYTTPASEFLYGTSVIFAALTAMRRKMYKLYVYSGENREVGVKQDSIEDLARDRKVQVIKVDGEWLRIMDKLSAGRPHNVSQPACYPFVISAARAFRIDEIKGYILEASPLPKLPVTGLQSVVDRTQESFSVCLDYQSAEDEAVNGTENRVKFKPEFPRYPFVLLLDGIVSISAGPHPNPYLSEN